MRILFALILIIATLESASAQSNNIKLDINDFSVKSHYYQSDILKKMEIFNYLSNFDISEKNLRDVLLNKCLGIGESIKSTEKDSLSDVAKTLKTMGSPVFCIDEIDSDGNIMYHTSPSGNLKIVLNEGMLKRN